MRFLGLSVALIWIASVSTSHASCTLEVSISGQFTDRQLQSFLRCLYSEVVEVKRENEELRRQIKEIGEVMNEMPAPYSNIDGQVTEEPGRAIGTATFVLSARSTGGANALPIDDRVLNEVCGASGGCSVSVAFRRIGLFDSEAKDNVLTGPCQFTYAADDGAWSRGAGCGDGPSSGTDGDRFSSAETDPVIASSGGACLFSESGPARSVDQGDDFLRDTAPGLFLVAMPSRQPDGIRRFQCELVLK